MRVSVEQKGRDGACWLGLVQRAEDREPVVWRLQGLKPRRAGEGRGGHTHTTDPRSPASASRLPSH